jgi:hypothetical protein
LPGSLGLAHGYARYIIAYNWSSVLVIAALMPPLMLLDLGLVGPGFAAAELRADVGVALLPLVCGAHRVRDHGPIVAARWCWPTSLLSLFINRLVG